jgi:thiamine-monophosphate kinase
MSAPNPKSKPSGGEKGDFFAGCPLLYIDSTLPLAEKTLIQRIRRQAGLPTKINRGRPNTGTGIGDDCAVLQLPSGHESLVTTDLCLEGIHFRRDWHSPQVVGHRCLARGLSDVAAMGGEPRAAFLSLALPAKLPQRWVDLFLKGLLTLACDFRITLAGGDTAESPAGILADIVLLGSVPKGKAILRSGARPGDRIYVSGELGGAAAAMESLVHSGRKKLRPRDFPRHFHPMPRIHVGRTLRQKNLASAMIDISDGLSTDLAHLCDESGVGAELRTELIPRARVGRTAREVKLDLALHGGEDYELLFTARPDRKIPGSIAGVPIHSIGEIRRGKHILLLDQRGAASELIPQGWEHLKS